MAHSERVPPASQLRGGIVFNRFELAGAFGDLGTLIPFVAAYITIPKMHAFGVLLAFGLAKIAAGLYYRTPFPVQPMKASGAIATTHATPFAVTPEIVHGAGLATGLIWLLLGASGATRRLASLVGAPVALGIILGLGFGFMLEGIRMMAGGWLLGGSALALTLLLLGNRRIPVMVLLLAAGIVVALLGDPALRAELAAIRPRLPAPEWAWQQMHWRDFSLGALFLALPQVPLTLSNAIIAVTAENNKLFPERQVSEKEVSLSTGWMNLLGSLLGGVPMCHGAGGMAGHVAFGARSGGAMIFLGSLLVLLALFLSDSVTILLRVFPAPMLGVILFIAGLQLALGMAAAASARREELLVMLLTAAFGIWNIGIAFLAGVLLYHAMRRGWRP